jgi:hypothetical protein
MPRREDSLGSGLAAQHRATARLGGCHRHPLAIQLPECWAGAAVLINLDQKDLVRTWAPVDTAAGTLYVGAAYLSPRAQPLGVQFWASVFDRPLPQLIAVLLHEAYHVISPAASESEASAFGRPCASIPRTPSS